LTSIEDVDMEDGDAAGHIDLSWLAASSLDTGARRDSPDPQSDEEDEWDIESVSSDASTDVLIEEDEDDVVPRSFSLSTLTNSPLPSDHSKLDEQPIAPSSKSEEEPSSPSVGVCGSDSKCLHSFHL
jgi:hypothetical protein